MLRFTARLMQASALLVIQVAASIRSKGGGTEYAFSTWPLYLLLHGRDDLLISYGNFLQRGAEWCGR